MLKSLRWASPSLQVILDDQPVAMVPEPRHSTCRDDAIQSCMAVLQSSDYTHLPITAACVQHIINMFLGSPPTHLPLTCHSPARQLIRKVSLTLGSRKEHAPHLLFSLSWCGFEGYGGEYCQGTEVSLLSALPVLGNINPGQWTYFSIILLADGGSWQKNGIQLAFAADGGQPALLAKRGQYPTFADNDVRSLTQQGTHLISPNFEFK